jgi:hypothetical protein
LTKQEKLDWLSLQINMVDYNSDYDISVRYRGLLRVRQAVEVDDIYGDLALSEYLWLLKEGMSLPRDMSITSNESFSFYFTLKWIECPPIVVNPAALTERGYVRDLKMSFQSWKRVQDLPDAIAQVLSLNQNNSEQL